MHTIYYMEDDGDISASVTEYLSRRGFLVRCFSTAAGMRQALLKFRPDLLILDWNMPDGAGDELCGWARERWPGLPIILLTVRDSTQEVVAGFRNGADDYVTKPFELDVLYSRIQALLRRSLPKNPAFLRCDNIMLDLEAQRVYMEKEGRQAEIILSASEYELLRILMEHKGKTIARSWLLERIWDQKGSYVNDNTLTVTMKRVREKLFCPACLKTIRSLGYRMEDTV